MPATHYLVNHSTHPSITLSYVQSMLICQLLFPIGAFGSGAAFALEDGWILARAIELVTSRASSTYSDNDRDRQVIKARNIADALEIFNDIRSPYYRRMYEHLDSQKAKVSRAQTEAKSQSNDPTYIFESVLPSRLEAFPVGDELSWIYKNDIAIIWQQYLRSKQEGELSLITLICDI
jgi:salicylate hydroxylase